MDAQPQPAQPSAIETSESIAKIAAALARAQGEIRPALKDTKNDFFNSRYADLAAVLEVCRAPLATHGIALVQAPSSDGKRVRICTLLLHESGEWIRATLTLTAQQDTPQAIGSAITYGRRYGLQAMVGIPAEDDDGEGSEGRGAQPPTKMRPASARLRRETLPPAEPLPDQPPPVDVAGAAPTSWRTRVAETPTDGLSALSAEIVANQKLSTEKKQMLLAAIEARQQRAGAVRGEGQGGQPG